MSSSLTERCSFHHSRSWLSKTRAPTLQACFEPLSSQTEQRAEGLVNQLNRTYSKSAACLLMPIGGGAIQLAYLPASTTRPINEAT